MKTNTIIGLCVVMALVLALVSSASDAWWNSDYDYRMPVEINNTAGQALTDYQVNVSIPSGGINATSIRVVNETAGTTVYHWCENVTGGDCYELWFNAPHVPAGTWCNDTYAIYYGNTAVASTSDYDNTFTKSCNTTGLVLEMHMDEGTGFSQTNDTSGEGNHGTLTNMNTTGNATSGWQGTDGGQWDNRDDMVFADGDHLQFDGTDDYVDCGNDASLDITDEITLAGWVYRKAGGSTYSRFIDTGYATQYQIMIQKGGTRFEAGFEINGTWRSATTVQGSLPLNEWHYIVATYDGAYIRAYLDGVLIKTTGSYIGTIATSENNLTIGSSVSGIHNLNADIDDVRIYNRALSEDEIYRMYIRSKYAADAPTATLGEETEFRTILDFIYPTPANESTIYVNHTTINVSINTTELTYFAFNWNGTNYTYTTCGSQWNESLDTYTRSTTVGSYTQPDFDNIFPWSHVRRCLLWDNGTVNYYLNTTNSSLKADGGLADLTGGDGQVMVQIPKFYFDHSFDGATHDWNISRFNLTGFKVHEAFIKNGVEVDYRYIGAYEGSMWDATTSAMVPPANIIDDMYAAGDKLCSYSGEYPKTNEMRSEFRTMAAQRGTGWRQLDFDLNSAVQILYIIEYADFNSLTTIGMGRTELSGGSWVADSYIGQCGKSDGDGDGTNSVAGNTNNAYMTYRGIENWYGNVWKFNDGININANVPYVSNNDSVWADDTSTGYDALAITLANTNGWQKTLEQTDRGFLPASVGGTDSTYICDYYYQAAGWRTFSAGGGAYYGAHKGAFSMGVGNAASGVNASLGGRLSF